MQMFYCLFIYVLALEIHYQEGTTLTPPHFCACHKPGTGFPMRGNS